MFPLHIQDDDLQWKISLNYDLQNDKFLLHINDKSFHQMPSQTEVNPEGPQNIDFGAIVLNDVEVHDGFAQYTEYTVDEWHKEIK